MAVVTSARGAVIFGVSKSGGAVVGYAIDTQGKMSATGMTIASSAAFTSVAASSVGDHYIVSSVFGDNTVMTLANGDLTQVVTLGKVPGSLVATSPIVTARQVNMTVTAGANGVLISTLDDRWQPSGSQQLAPMAIGMDAANYGGDALVAWSTQYGCQVQEIAVSKTATGLDACREPRLAVGWGDRAELAYVSNDGVHVGDLYMSGNNAIASTHLIGARGTSPRIAFDGERYWMTYLDARGAVAVGYLSEDFGTLVSMRLEDVTPTPDAYDLKIVNGQPIVFSAGSKGYAAHTICLVH